MINITEKNKCCYCSACSQICPQKCISFFQDNEGFYYPNIDKSKCINCNLCTKVCPELNIPEKHKILSGYLCRVKDTNILDSSTSGGAFYAISKVILDKKGFVYGAGYSNEFVVVHKGANNLSEIEEFRGSKYVQSLLGDVFGDVKSKLEKNEYVLFSGTPCQIAGLISFLNRTNISTEKLFTVEVLCHGVSSPAIFKEYLQCLEKRYHSKITNVKFRNKTYGYHFGTMKVSFENRKLFYGSGRYDYMLKIYQSDASMRPSCYSCFMKGSERLADFTIFDAWHALKIEPSLKKDDGKGYSHLFINTTHGLSIQNDVLSSLEFFQEDIDKAIELDGIMFNHQPIPKVDRDNLFDQFQRNGLERGIIRNVLPVSTKDKIIEKIVKPCMLKLGYKRKIK